MSSQIDSRKAPRLADFRRRAGDFHSVAKQASFCIASRNNFSWFWNDFRRFWDLNMDATIDFWIIFCDVFFECVLASIFRRFLGTPTLKNQQKPLFFQWFLWIFTKSTFSKHIRKYGDAGFVFGSQNDEKARTNYVEKCFLFWHRFSIAFFRIVAFWGRFWEAQDPPKIINNRKKSIPGCIRSAFQNSIRFGRQFWSNHWRCWIDCWTILKVFWKNFEETCSLRNGFCRTYFDD